MIVERTHYYARSGKAAAVLAARREASRIRVAIGLPAGSIRRKVRSAKDGPDVAWECAFADAAAHRADLAARAASAEFTTIRAKMTGLITRFERLFETDGAATSSRAPAVLKAHPSIRTFRSQGRKLKAYLWTPPGEGPFPLIIYNHGSGLREPFEDNALPGLPLLFASWGYACLFPHRHGYGLSPGPDWRSECPGRPFTRRYNASIVARLEREAQDVMAAFAYASKLATIDSTRIAFMGSSFGGTNTLLAAEAESRARCALAFASAAMNWDRNPLIAQRLLNAVAKIRAPLFLAQARNDFSIKPTQAMEKRLRRTGQTFVAKIYPPFGATAMEGHFLAGRGAQIWSEDVRRFLKEHLA
jgi:dienelactone hydrolase